MKSKRAAKLPLASSDAPAPSLGSLDSALLQKLESVVARPFTPSETKEPLPPSKKSLSRLVLRRETKERGGKTVVIVSGFAAEDTHLEETARRLRRELGCGGTVQDGEIVLQGDRPEAVAAALRNAGHLVRGIGA